MRKPRTAIMVFVPLLFVGALLISALSIVLFLFALLSGKADYSTFTLGVGGVMFLVLAFLLRKVRKLWKTAFEPGRDGDDAASMQLHPEHKPLTPSERRKAGRILEE